MTHPCRSAALRGLLGLALLAGLQPLPASAQDSPGGPARIQWWHGLIAVGGYAVLSRLDDGIQSFFQENRSPTSDDIADVIRPMGQPEVYATVGLGILASGVLAGDREVRQAGVRISTALATTGVVVTLGKFAAGRIRPSKRGSNAADFRPFSGNTSAPSGHAAMAFALAASLGEEIHDPWVSAALYTAAAGTAWSRVNDNVHWLSDVIAGATVGVVIAKYINGKVTVFGVKPPRLRPAPGGAALTWSGSF